MFENQVTEVNFDKTLPFITPEEENQVRKYVNPHFFQVEMMLDYLNMHDSITKEIFDTCITPRAAKSVQFTFIQLMKPVSREVFIKRLPIYFYDINVSTRSEMTRFFDGYRDYELGETSLEDIFAMDLAEEDEYPEDFDFEHLYEVIDDVVFNYKIPMEKVLQFMNGQSGDVGIYEVFDKWYQYIKLVDNLTEENVFPDNIYYALNVELEKTGHDPIMYFPVIDRTGEYIAFRDGESFNIGGYFPSDEDGHVATQWVAIWPYKVRDLTEEEKERSKANWERQKKLKGKIPALRTTLRIPIGPETRVFIGHEDLVSNGAFSDDDVFRQYWKEAFSGSKIVKIDCSKIAKIREKRGYSVKDITDGTGINIRTYQRIETGEGSPDALNLVKIMKFLEIEDYDELVYKEVLEDPDFEKFKTGKSIGKFLESCNKTEEVNKSN